MATRTLLGFDNDTEAEDVTLNPSRSASSPTTRRAASTIACPLCRSTSLDVAYLGTVILDLAQLPLSDSHAERKRLMQLCKGRYYACKERDEILAFHRRLIDSGVMAAR